MIIYLIFYSNQLGDFCVPVLFLYFYLHQVVNCKSYSEPRHYLSYGCIRISGMAPTLGVVLSGVCGVVFSVQLSTKPTRRGAPTRICGEY